MLNEQELKAVRYFINKKKEYLKMVRSWNKSLALLRQGVVTPHNMKLMVSMAEFISAELGMVRMLENAEKRDEGKNDKKE